MTYEFKSTGEWFHITQRGWTIGISKEQIPEGMWNPGELAGQKVKIDGNEYLCRGVEMFRPMISPTNPYKYDFGLLVSDEEYEKYHDNP